MGPSSTRNPGFPGPSPTSKKPLKPRALAMTTPGCCEALGNLGLPREAQHTKAPLGLKPPCTPQRHLRTCGLLCHPQRAPVAPRRSPSRRLRSPQLLPWSRTGGGSARRPCGAVDLAVPKAGELAVSFFSVWHFTFPRFYFQVGNHAPPCTSQTQTDRRVAGHTRVDPSCYKSGR